LQIGKDFLQALHEVKQVKGDAFTEATQPILILSYLEASTISLQLVSINRMQLSATKCRLPIAAGHLPEHVSCHLSTTMQINALCVFHC